MRCEVEVVAEPRTGKAVLGRYSWVCMCVCVCVFGKNRHGALATRGLVCFFVQTQFVHVQEVARPT